MKQILSIFLLGTLLLWTEGTLAQCPCNNSNDTTSCNENPSCGSQCMGTGGGDFECGCNVNSDCNNASNGHKCVGDGWCGCSGNGDCPNGSTCQWQNDAFGFCGSSALKGRAKPHKEQITSGAPKEKEKPHREPITSIPK